LYNYFIIERESNSVHNIQNVLENYQDFNCIGISNQYNQSLDIILKDVPNLVFFNIDNTFENPYSLIQELNSFFNEDLPLFVAISSSKDKAFEVIKNGFFDFLLNPLTDLEIRKTILKFQKKNPVKTKKNICLKSYKDYQYLDTDEILFLKADNNTTDFYMSDGNIVSSFKTLKTYEDLLPTNFLRIHKSYIINKNHVSRIQYGKLICSIKKNSHDIPFSKTYFDNVEAMKNTLSMQTCHMLN
jgi:DNA-binding LytR/AlgR family response regulator